MSSVTESLYGKKYGHRVFSLDVLRGVAILFVLFHHNPIYPESRSVFYDPIIVLNSIGWSGVDLFFVLSGYLIGGHLIKEVRKTGKVHYPTFIKKRIFKIWPVYYVFLMVFIAINCWRGESVGELLANHWPNFLHIQNYFVSTKKAGWLWSLGVEEHFYLILPFAVAWISLWSQGKTWVRSSLMPFVAMLGVFTLVILARSFTQKNAVGESPMFSLVFASHLRIDALSLGVLLAYLEITSSPFFMALQKFAKFFLLLGLALVLLPFLYHRDHQLFLYPYGLTLTAIGFFFMVNYALTNQQRVRDIYLAENSPFKVFVYGVGLVVAFIGVRSYSIYVWHGFLAKPMANRITQALGVMGGDPWLGPINELIYLAAPIGLGLMSFYGVEQPFMNLRDRYLKSS